MEQTEPLERVLELNGTIAEESWFDDDVTPQMFKDELFSGNGPVTVWLNSPGGDCIAASQIYAMLMVCLRTTKILRMMRDICSLQVQWKEPLLTKFLRRTQ